MEQHKFKLFIIKGSPASNSLVERVQSLLKDKLKTNYLIEVIDILEYPELALESKIIASPTLIQELPLPQKRLIGQFNDNEKIIAALNLLKKDNI